MQRQLKMVTAKVDVTLSKASHAADCEKFLLDEIENLGKSLKCESLDLLSVQDLIFGLFAQMCASTVLPRPGA
jgi:hypothetical protein